MPHNHWFRENKKRITGLLLTLSIIQNVSLWLRHIRITEYEISSKVYRDRTRKEKKGGVGRGGGGRLLFALTGIYNAVFIAYLTITAEWRQ
jgi:hypothetical protein